MQTCFQEKTNPGSRHVHREHLLHQSGTRAYVCIWMVPHAVQIVDRKIDPYSVNSTITLQREIIKKCTASMLKYVSICKIGELVPFYFLFIKWWESMQNVVCRIISSRISAETSPGWDLRSNSILNSREKIVTSIGMPYTTLSLVVVWLFDAKLQVELSDSFWANSWRNSRESFRNKLWVVITNFQAWQNSANTG